MCRTREFVFQIGTYLELREKPPLSVRTLFFVCHPERERVRERESKDLPASGSQSGHASPAFLQPF